MRLLIIRHAVAVERGTPEIADDDRPLTRKGRRSFQKAARGLARIQPRPDTLLTSPLPRARETAEIAAQAWGKLKPKNTDVLAGGSFAEIAGVLDKLPRDATVAVVGHEPDVSELLPELTLAQKWDLGALELARNVHTHPTLSEALQEAFHGLAGHMINM